MDERTILRVWEIGQKQHPAYRALTILSAAYPQQSWDELAALRKGWRDARLLSVRRTIFGPNFNGFLQCQECQEKLEIILNLDTFLGDTDPDEPEDERYSFKKGEYEVSFRPPNSYDLSEIVGVDSALAPKILLSKCVLSATRKGKRISKSRLPKKIMNALQAEMSAVDPLAVVKLSAQCTNCSHQNEMDFNILACLWAELAALAKNLLYQVHLLARYYGWPEADILAMGAVRRQAYLELMNR